MERTCTAITSNDKDAVMHLEIYAPEDKSNLKGMIQICHGMTEYVWRYKSFAEYFTSRGYIVFGNDIISHGRSNTSKSLGLYFNDWRNVYDDAEKTRAYVQEKVSLPAGVYSWLFTWFLCRKNNGQPASI